MNAQILAESQLKSILEGMLDPVLVIDAWGTIHLANESCAGVFGHPPAGLVGRNIKLLMPEPYRAEHDGYLEHYRRTGQTKILGRTRAFPILRADGQRIECELSVSRIDVPGVDEPVFAGSFRDITERRRAERALAESERRFRAIFDQEVQYVGLLDPNGVVLEANRTALDAVGARREDVVGRPFWETPWWTHSATEQARLREAVRDAARGETVRFETSHPDGEGGIVHMDFSLKPFRDEHGRIVLLLPEGRDISDVKRAQQREVAMMRAFADIGESASLLAHEIKSPITAVNLALRAVAQQLGEDDRAVIEDLVERMRKLEALMRRTLSLARPLELRRAPCALDELARGVERALRPQLEAKRVALELELPAQAPRPHADPQLLDEVLTNLVRNALDAVQPGGRVRLELAAQEGAVLVRVDDDGPGVPDELRSTLFRPFVTSKPTGTGLGLALARKIVEAHGGTLEALDSPLGGARFEVRLPALQPLRGASPRGLRTKA